MLETINQEIIDKELSQEEYLLQQHEEFLRNVYESGYPIWILDTYHNGGY